MGTYSVADHCAAFAFVSDLILYDRIIVPVPPPDDRAEWKRWADNCWQPKRQKMLLNELGDYVKRVEWTADMRQQWAGIKDEEAGDAAGFAGDDLEMMAGQEREARIGRPDPYGATRRLLAHDVGARLLDGADARVLSVYASPDRFDRHWRVVRSFPFVRRSTELERAETPRAVEQLSRDQQQSLASQGQLATVIVGKFVLPIDDASPRTSDDHRDREALISARKLPEDENVSAKRRALHTWIAKYDAKQIPDEAKAEEFDDLLKDYNAAARAKKKLDWVNTGLVVLRPVAAGASIFAPQVGVGASVADGAIGTLATRYFAPGDWQPEDIRAAALVSDAQNAISG